MVHHITQLDKFEVTLLQQLNHPCLMPFCLTKTKESISVTYHDTNVLPMSTKEKLRESDVIVLLRSFVQTCQQLENYFLNARQLLLSLDTIYYMNENTTNENITNNENTTNDEKLCIKWSYLPQLVPIDTLEDTVYVNELLQNILMAPTLTLETTTLLPLYQLLNQPVTVAMIDKFLKERSTRQQTTLYDETIAPQLDEQNNDDHQWNIQRVHTTHEHTTTNKQHEKIPQTTNGLQTPIPTVHIAHNNDHFMNAQLITPPKLSLWAKMKQFLNKKEFSLGDDKPNNQLPLFETTVLNAPLQQTVHYSLEDTTLHNVFILPLQHSFIIGSYDNNMMQLQVTDGISRQHAKLIKQNDVVVISDLFSTNGTYINGDKIVSGEFFTLAHGDVITVGQRQFMFKVSV